jgi:putative ABC transport system substrate-binding protein
MPARVLRNATHNIPIVFATVSDPNGTGLVESITHPGGNITGYSNIEPTIGAKWLEILHQIAPRIMRAIFIFNPVSSPISPPFAHAAEMASTIFSTEVDSSPVHEASDLESVIKTTASQAGGSGLIFPPDTFTGTHSKEIIELADHYKLPAIYPYRYFVDDGGLASYGTNAVDSFAQSAGYVDRILRGIKPADLPVQAPTKYELVINLKTAKALGLVVPDRLLATADEVIE